MVAPLGVIGGVGEHGEEQGDDRPGRKLGERAQREHEPDVGRPGHVEQCAARDAQAKRAQHQSTLAHQADQRPRGSGARHSAEQARHHERAGQPRVTDIMGEIIDDGAVLERRERHEQNADAEQDEPRTVAPQIGRVLLHAGLLCDRWVHSLTRRGERDHEQNEGEAGEERHRRRVRECRPVSVERMEEGRCGACVRGARIGQRGDERQRETLEQQSAEERKTETVGRNAAPLDRAGRHDAHQSVVRHVVHGVADDQCAVRHVGVAEPAGRA